MNHEFFSLSLSRKALLELHRATLARFLMETSLRQEQGLETVPYPTLLENIERLLGMSTEDAHQILHHMEAELWEFTWYNYTDEWAWHRARRDVIKELGARAKKTDPLTLEQLVSRRYEECFEAYVGEIDMKEEPVKKERVGIKRSKDRTI
ncbi:hypothetical protein FJZ48_00150 [Candidatus Uhrbacteria bacterium]|nr:hypothetical protein [Candidatus Uhrbacteria bacterium]